MRGTEGRGARGQHLGLRLPRARYSASGSARGPPVGLASPPARVTMPRDTIRARSASSGRPRRGPAAQPRRRQSQSAPLPHRLPRLLLVPAPGDATAINQFGRERQQPRRGGRGPCARARENARPRPVCMLVRSFGACPDRTGRRDPLLGELLAAPTSPMICWSCSPRPLAGALRKCDRTPGSYGGVASTGRGSPGTPEAETWRRARRAPRGDRPHKFASSNGSARRGHHGSCVDTAAPSVLKP